MVLTAYIALSPVTGLCCHRHLRIIPQASALALFVKSAFASTASRPAFVTIASRPHLGTGRRGYVDDLGRKKSRKFFARGLDTV
jgi:hypothetical protein